MVPISSVFLVRELRVVWMTPDVGGSLLYPSPPTPALPLLAGAEDVTFDWKASKARRYACATLTPRPPAFLFLILFVYRSLRDAYVTRLNGIYTRLLAKSGVTVHKGTASECPFPHGVVGASLPLVPSLTFSYPFLPTC
jgi:hypothetical protein